ncbi:MAG: hypothetical protein D6732_00940 [Methanobacteriota archaeon]|nr:MAG: hypothetical protein D6732_00940 [Euryarchaeota archaeon]
MKDKRKILHITHTLPDIRVEKMMLGGKDLGFDVEIAVERFNGFWFKDLEHTRVHIFPSSAMDQFGFRKTSVTAIQDIIKKVDPDIIHAHDIYIAHFVSQATDRRFVYDDHEFWSKNVGLKKPQGSIFRKLKRSIGLAIRRRTVPTWEKEILQNNVVITVTDQIANHHRNYSRDVFVIENFPHSKEISDIPEQKRERDLGVYIGKDLTMEGSPYRDASEFLKFVQDHGEIKMMVVGDNNISSNNQIISTGFIPHTQILKTISNASFGFLPWKPHPDHAFFCPNKIYLYAHAGLHSILPKTFVNHNLLSFAYFETYDDFLTIMQNPPTFTPKEIMQHAREELVFERRYDELKQAYNIL